MVCTRCGRVLPEDVRVCPECGNALDPRAAYGPQADGPRQAALKKLVRSPLTLAALLAYTISLVLDLVLGMDTPMDTLLGAVLPTLIAVGLWITYAGAYREKGMPTAGLTMIKVVQLIELVAVCVAGAFLVLAIVLAMAAIRAQGAILSEVEMSLLTTTFGITAGVIVAVLALVIVFLARVIGSINAAKQVIATDRVTGKVSILVAVLLIIGAVGSLIGALASEAFAALIWSSVEELEAADVSGDLTGLIRFSQIQTGPIAGVVGAVSNILFAAVIFSYQSRVQSLPAEPIVPGYGYQPVAPAAQPVWQQAPAQPEEEEPFALVAPQEAEAPGEQEAVYCANCGRKMPPNCRFCTNCGAPR